MKQAFDLSGQAGLNDFVEVAVDVLNSNMTTIAGIELQLKAGDSFKCAPADFSESFANGVALIATEEQSGSEIGLIFNTPDITSLADFMLMGDGASKDELDDDTKDAVTEIANQFFGGISIPLEARISKKLQFKMKLVDKFDPELLLSDSYISVTLSGQIKDKPIQVDLFVDEKFSDILGDGGAVTLNTTDFFAQDNTASAPVSGMGGGYPTGTNMDMLLDIEIPVSVRMGTAKLFLKDILGLGPGNIVELEQNADEPIELVVNGKLVARGEVVIVDGYFGFRIKEIISKAERIRKLKD